MKAQISNTGKSKNKGHSHAKHMWMMAVCCGLPIAGFIAIAILGISMPSLETLLLVICPVGMVGMMYMMNRDNHGNQKDSSCCQSEKSEDKSLADIRQDGNESSQHGSTKPQPSGSLEA